MAQGSRAFPCLLARHCGSNRLMAAWRNRTEEASDGLFDDVGTGPQQMKKIQQIEATWKFQETGLKYNREIHGASTMPLLGVAPAPIEVAH